MHETDRTPSVTREPEIDIYLQSRAPNLKSGDANSHAPLQRQTSHTHSRSICIHIALNGQGPNNCGGGGKGPEKIKPATTVNTTTT